MQKKGCDIESRNKNDNYDEGKMMIMKNKEE